MKKAYIYMCLLTLAFVMPGCKKYLYEKPITNSYDEIFWVNEKNATQAVSGAYFLFRDALRNGQSYFTFADVAADNMVNFEWNWASLLRDPGNFKFGYVPYLEDQLWDWSKFYDAIAQCNLVLDKVPGIPESGFTNAGARDRLMGEAYFIRAYAYFYILRVWGEPVLATVPIRESELSNPPNLARSSDADAIKQIQADLAKAIQLLPESTDEQPVKANKYAAYALKTHVDAWDHKWESAIASADAVINSDQYELADSSVYRDIWRGKTDEPIFELATRFNTSSNETGGLSFFGALLRIPQYNKNGGLIVNTAKLFGRINEYNTNDVFYVGKDSLYSALDLRYRKCFVKETKGAMLVKYADVTLLNPDDQSTLMVDNNLVMIRLADIMLLKAEALANLNRNGEAEPIVNEIRERAGVRDYDPAKDGLLKTFVIDERQRELFGEGNAFYDLIRSGLLSQRIPAYAGERWQQKGYYWPLNLRKLKPANDKLTQNYYWATH